MEKKKQQEQQEQQGFDQISAVKQLLEMSGFNSEALFSGAEWLPEEVLSTRKNNVNTNEVSIARDTAEKQAEARFRALFEEVFGVPASKGDLKEIALVAKTSLSKVDPTLQNDLFAQRKENEIYKEALLQKEKEIENIRGQYKTRAALESMISKYRTVGISKDWLLRGLEEDLNARYQIIDQGGILDVRSKDGEVIKTPLGKVVTADEVILGLLRERGALAETHTAAKNDQPLLPKSLQQQQQQQRQLTSQEINRLKILEKARSLMQQQQQPQ